jgi:hypothetical protein
MNATLPPPVPNRDALHLKVIEIFHYVLAGLAVAGMAFLFVHYTIMSTAFSNPHVWEQMEARQKQPMPFDPVAFFHAFIWFYIFFGAWGMASFFMNVISGFCIRSCRWRMFSLIVAGVNCVNFPFGTALGIFTLIVLLRPTMPAIYGEVQR